MKTKIRVILTVLALCMAVSVNAFAYTVEDVDFGDLVAPGSELEKEIETIKDGSENPSSWAVSETAQAISLNLVPDHLQRRYTAPMTRAEFCALGVRLYETVTGNEIKEQATFADTTDLNVQKLAGIGVINGVGNNRFAPDSSLTRGQAATIIDRLMTTLGKPLDEATSTFADDESISSWAKGAVGKIQYIGIMNGTGENKFTPAGAYTREQCILTMLRTYNVYQSMN